MRLPSNNFYQISLQTCTNSPTFVVMNNLSLHIQYLLTRHDCVVVPGWGSLVVQHSPALFVAGNPITPPRRWLSFNPLLSHNDAMLAHSIMHAQQCSYDEAMATINEQVAAWHDTIAHNRILLLDNIGSFSPQENNTIIFTEAPSSIINKSLELLPAIELPLLTDAVSIDEVEEPQHPSQPASLSWYQRTISAVASIAAIVIVMLFISTPIDNMQPDNNYAGMVAAELLTHSHTAAIAIEEPATPIEEATSEIIDTPTPCEEHTSSVDAIVDTPSQASSAPIIAHKTTPRYILVIGSLPSQALAEKQIAEFVSMGISDPINIYESNGRYRLYIEGYNTLQQAQERLDEMTTQALLPVAGIWICSTL